MTTITQVISEIGTAADPLTQLPPVFSTNAAANVAAIKVAIPQMNTFAGQVNTVAGEVSADAAAAAQSVIDAADEVALAAAQVALATASAGESATAKTVALAAANFVGSWSALTGAKTVPLSVERNGRLYYLLNSIANVTASEPGVTGDWASFGNTTLSTRTGNTIIQVLDHSKVIEYTSGTFSQTFDTAANLGNGFSLSLQNSGTGTVTLDPAGAELINGAATLVLPPGTIALVTCNGTALTAKLFALAAGDSHVTVTTGNGHGSTNTMTRRFTTTLASAGTDVTYADSATLGATFTVNQTALYEIHYKDRGVGVYFGVSVNSTQLTTAINSITAANRIMAAHTPGGGGFTAGITRIVRLNVGDVVRAHTAGTVDGTAAVDTMFSIRKIGF